MIQAKGIIKSFGENHVLKGVDVDFYPGKRISSSVVQDRVKRYSLRPF